MPTISEYLHSLGGSVEPLSPGQLSAAVATWVATYGQPKLEHARTLKRGAHKWKVFSHYQHAIAAHGLQAIEQFQRLNLGAYIVFNDQETWGFHCQGGAHPDFSDAGETIYIATPEWTIVFVDDHYLAFLARPRALPH
jgi:hypothetical protein